MPLPQTTGGAEGLYPLQISLAFIFRRRRLSRYFGRLARWVKVCRIELFSADQRRFVVISGADDDASTSLSSAVESRCHVTYGDVIDKAARKNVSICGRAEQDGGLSRVYVSQSNLISIVFTSPRRQQHNFIIHVEGIEIQPGEVDAGILDRIFHL